MKSELEHIFDFIESDLGFIKDPENTNRFVRTVPGRTNQIIINGQRSVQKEPDHEVSIVYAGEGSISTTGSAELPIPIWGFDIYEGDQPAGPTEYVDSLDQFKSLFTRG